MNVHQGPNWCVKKRKERVKTFTGTEFVCASLKADNFSLIRERKKRLKPIDVNLKTTNTQFSEEFFNYIKKGAELKLKGYWIKV